MGTPPVAEAVARVLLLRHGQSTWNVEARWQGRADPPLSPAGEGQARQAAPALTGAVAVWSSDLARARRTAELLAPGDVTVRVDARLRERDVGPWTASDARGDRRAVPRVAHRWATTARLGG